MAAMKRFHVLIPEEDFEWITGISEENSITVSDVIRDAISSYRLSHSKVQGIEKRSTPHEEDQTLARALERIANLEQFVFSTLPRVQAVPSRLLSEIVEFAPGYMLGKPPENLRK